MRRLGIVQLTIMLVITGLALLPGVATADPGGRMVSVTGAGVGMYPAFDPAITRYAITTTAETAGTITVTPTPGDAEQVLINGVPTSGATTFTDLTVGDEVSVIFTGSGTSAAYSLIYLPAGFPELTVNEAKGSFPGLAPGLIGLTLHTYSMDAPLPSYNALVDRNGVPVWAVLAGPGDMDLKRQPNGELSIMSLSKRGAGHGTALVTLDERLRETARYEVAAPFVNTDGHDAIRLPDRSTVLMGYEPRVDGGTTYTDATLQKFDRAGNLVFSWDSQAFFDESVNEWLDPQTGQVDYAHINSVQEVPDGTGDLIASFRHFSAVFRITTRARGVYAKGDVVWKFGGRDNDFTLIGDEHYGPCAQHTAYLTDPTHLVIFDNGSAPISGGGTVMCLDPADPTGPTIDRRLTRITEYELDEDAMTAALVSDYRHEAAPTGMAFFAFFAGSAARLANGNTLIGWADERTLLASEIDASDNELWSLTTPPTQAEDKFQTGRYVTYRASLVDHSDAIPPEISLNPSGSLSYKVGASTPRPTWSCRDRGGSTLQSCQVTGLVNGGLDTRTPGTRTVRVTARDGAGNSTTKSLTYTVSAFKRAADLAIRLQGSSAWVGAQSIMPSRQVIRQALRRKRARAVFWVRLTNTGEKTDTFGLRAAGGTKKFPIRYWVGAKNVTRPVTGGSYRVTLAPGASTSIKVIVRRAPKARPGNTRAAIVQGWPIGAWNLRDRVDGIAIARR